MLNYLNRYQKKFCFSLVELLLVMAIIVILGTIIIINVQDTFTKANDSKRIQEANQIKNALVEYYLKNNYQFPVSFQPRCIEEIDPQTGKSILTPLVEQGLLPRLPQDPLYNSQNPKEHCFLYFTDSQGSSFKIIVKLEVSPSKLASEDGGLFVDLYEVYSPTTLGPKLYVGYQEGGTVGSWGYMRPITIVNTLNSNELFNYQISFEIEGVFNKLKDKIDCSDIAFSDGLGGFYNFWIERCDDPLKIWVKVDDIPASSQKTIYMSYSNENPPVGFLNFDDTFTKDYSQDKGLLGQWNMDESSHIIYDSSNKSNDGILGDGSCSPGSGRCPARIADGGYWDSKDTIKFSSGAALSFDGVNDSVLIQDSDALDGWDKFTIELWVKPIEIKETILISKWDSGNFSWYLGFTPGGINGNKVFLKLSPDGTSPYTLRSSGYLPINKWAHLVIVGDGSRVKVYINGEEDAQTINFQGPVFSGNANVLIGKDLGETQFFKGELDEMRIYNRILSKAEIKAHIERRVYTDPQPGVNIGNEEVL
mgnify:CR=1 FL=1